MSPDLQCRRSLDYIVRIFNPHKLTVFDHCQVFTALCAVQSSICSQIYHNVDLDGLLSWVVCYCKWTDCSYFVLSSPECFIEHFNTTKMWQYHVYCNNITVTVLWSRCHHEVPWWILGTHWQHRRLCYSYEL